MSESLDIFPAPARPQQAALRPICAVCQKELDLARARRRRLTHPAVLP